MEVSQRNMEIAALAVSGMSPKDIREKLKVSKNTVAGAIDRARKRGDCIEFREELPSTFRSRMDEINRKLDDVLALPVPRLPPPEQKVSGDRPVMGRPNPRMTALLG